MYKIQTLNRISTKGLECLPREEYETASEILNPDAILLRSFKMHDLAIADTVMAIARAGAGVNNIPVAACTERGIVVFNTPGANANGVKELVFAGLFLCSRGLVDGIEWARGLKDKGDEVPKLVEKGKSAFAGPEIKGKRLGIVGLGAIGVMVANDAAALGMEVSGYDPFLSVEAAWGLSRSVRRAPTLDALLAESDYITLHVPLNNDTRGMMNRDRFTLMKKTVRLLNFARGGLVNNEDLKQAIADGIIEAYVTDFPDEDLLKMEKVIALPHLGASTPEAEDNCAIMAVNQLRNYLENGNIHNSVNFPDCEMARSDGTRLLIANNNIPRMVSQITSVLADEKFNISDMLNKHRADLAYNIVDIDGTVNDAQVKRIRAIQGIVMVRVL